MQLVDEADDLALGFFDLLQDRLQPLLKFAAIFRAGEHRAEIERDEAFVLQSFGHVARNDPLRESFDDRGLADAGFADQHRIVLGPARKDLDRAADLVVAPDDRIEFALACQLGQVVRVFRERLKFSSAFCVVTRAPARISSMTFISALRSTPCDRRMRPASCLSSAMASSRLSVEM